MNGILLTGAQGQLGWEVARRIRTAGLSCHALSKEELNVTARDAVSRAVDFIQPSVVINTASYTNVDRAESEIRDAFAVNRSGAANLARACAGANIPLIHFSTDYVFDGAKRTPYTENDAVSPIGVYGKSKLAGEDAIQDCCSKYVILRTAWLYGLHGQNFVKTILKLSSERGTIRVVDDQRGSPTFAGDLAEAILTLTRRLETTRWPDNGFGTFNCAGQGTATWCEFARAIFEYAAPKLGPMPKVEAISTADYPTTAKRPAYSVLDCNRLADVHGIVMRPWKRGLAEMLDSMSWAPRGRTNSPLGCKNAY
jgi:dTDP-4-dehydrorhamnose reductase